MIPGISERNFPNGVTLHEARITLADMGDRTIESQVRIKRGATNVSFVSDPNSPQVTSLVYKGEKFVLTTPDPPAIKENTTMRANVTLTFTSWVVQNLKRYFYFQPASTTAAGTGAAVADAYQASVRMSLHDFVTNFASVLKYYWPNDEITIDLHSDPLPNVKYLIEIDKQKIWDVLTKFYEIFSVRWKIEPDALNPEHYIIKVNYPTDSEDISDHTFQYGFDGGLLRFERQIPDDSVTNVLLGRGGEKNLPYRYFKLAQEQSAEGYEWTGDPDAIPELQYVNFDRLHGATFRWYVRGWMQNSHRSTAWDVTHQYPQYQESDINTTYSDAGVREQCLRAFNAGKTDEVFNPIEYVIDEGSIAHYGERWGYLDNNDEIYPTIRGANNSSGTPVDRVVDVSKIQTDDIADYAAQQAVEVSINSLLISVEDSEDKDFNLRSESFTVPPGKTCNITSLWFSKVTEAAWVCRIDTERSTLTAVKESGDGSDVSAVLDTNSASIYGIQPGTYHLELALKIATDQVTQEFSGTFGLSTIKAVLAPANKDEWKPTFDIWVPNIWDTQKNELEETDTEYAERVWLPILGDHLQKEAAIVFATGFLASSSDYEFTIASIPVHDESKSWGSISSHWRITLYKSDAEYNTSGKFIPNETLRPIQGDEYYFVGIDMPFKYVIWKEGQLTLAKLVALSSMKQVFPAWNISLDKVRINTVQEADVAGALAARLKPGVKLQISDPRFNPEPITLYASSVTYTWQEPSEGKPYLVPDVEVTLTDKVAPTSSSYTLLQGQVNAIQSEYIRASDVEEIVRRIAGDMFLKKTGEADESSSPTAFKSKVTSDGFRQGGVGGSGWGLYRSSVAKMSQAGETNSDSVMEADIIIARKELHVDTLVVNQIEAIGGKEILSAAKMVVTKVLLDEDDNYECYFDQKQGSVKNLFVKDDIVLCQKYDPSWQSQAKYYRMLVADVAPDHILLDATTKGGQGEPEVGDVIVQYGHKTNTARQSVIIRDVIGGGYEQMLTGLTYTVPEPEEGEEEEEPQGIYSDGIEYFFAGRQSARNAGRPSFFVGIKGETNNQYVEYDGQGLTIKGSARVDNVSGSTVIDGSFIQSGEIQLGQNQVVSGVTKLQVWAGISGIYGGNIAAWYGGDKIDKATIIDQQGAFLPGHENDRYARSLFRFDGSGYLAGNKIYWDGTGNGGIPGITWDDTAITISSEVKFKDNNNQLVGLIDAIKTLSGMFKLESVGGSSYRIKALHSLYSDGYISAGGIGSGGGGGGGGGGGTAVAWGDEDPQRANYRYLRLEGVNTYEVALLGHHHTFTEVDGLQTALNSKVSASDVSSAISTALQDYATQSWVTTQISNLDLGDAAQMDVVTVVNAQSTHDTIPTAKAVWDALTNIWIVDTVHTVGNKPTVKLNPDYAGAWTEGFLSAGGIGTTGGSGGGSSVAWGGDAVNNYESLVVEGDHTHRVALYGHTHDDRYYTETEIDTMLSALSIKHLDVQADMTVGMTGKTVAQMKAMLNTLTSTQTHGIGDNITIPSSLVSHWSDDTAVYYDSSVFSAIKVSGGYAGNRWGQWLLSSCELEHLYVIGKTDYGWMNNIKAIAFTDDNVASARMLKYNDNATPAVYALADGGTEFGGHLYLDKGKYIYHKCTDGINRSVIDFSSDDLELNYQLAERGDARIHGKNVKLYYVTQNGSSFSHNLGMVLTNEGKIGFGLSAPAYKYDFNGEANVRGYLRIAPEQESGVQDGLILHDNGTGAWEGLKILWTTESYSTPVALYPYFDTTTQFLRCSHSFMVGAGQSAAQDRRIYFGTTGAYIELDANGYLHTNVGFYSDSFVSAGGVGSGGSSGGSAVSWTQLQASGTQIATIRIDGVDTAVYAPTFSYTLPTASASTLGGVKVGSTLEIDANGVLNQKSGVFAQAGGVFSRVKIDTYGRVIEGSNPDTLTGIESIDGVIYLDDTNSRVGIGVAAPTVALDVNGSVKASSYAIGNKSITGFGSDSDVISVTANYAWSPANLFGFVAKNASSIISKESGSHLTVTQQTGGGVEIGVASGYVIPSTTDMQALGAITGNKTANYVFAGPASGSAGAASFRALVDADIPSAIARRPSSAVDGNVAKFSNKDVVDSGVAITDLARLSQSNTFTATNYVRNLLPSSDLTYYLGDGNGHAWDKLFVDEIHMSGSLMVPISSIADAAVLGVTTSSGSGTVTLGIVPASGAATHNIDLYAPSFGFYQTNNSQALNIGTYITIYNDIRPADSDVCIGDLNHRFDIVCASAWYPSSSGDVYVNYANSAFHFSVGVYSDSYVSAGGIGQSSDIRLKRGIHGVRLSVEDIANAPAVEFEWVKDGRMGAGSIAQYWEKCLPHNVFEDASGMKSLEYGPVALLSAITLARKVETHEEKIKRLEARVAELERQLNNA